MRESRMLTGLFLLAVTTVLACGPGAAVPTTTTRPPRPELPPLEALTVERHCGTGFWISAPDQTTALHIRYRGEKAPERETVLPDPDWAAELLQGTDLHANWCDDVQEPGEAEADVQFRHPVVAGTLVLVGDIPPETHGGGGNSLTLEAADLAVELPDGSHMPYGSVTITNSHWGLVPG